MKSRSARADNKEELKELVDAARSGDRNALGTLIEATQTRLFRFSLALCGDRARAEDLCQEAYIKAFHSLEKLENSKAFLDWLFRITKNIYLDEWRSKDSRETELDEKALEMSGAESRDFTDLINVSRALSQFEAEDKWLLLLVDLEERTYQEAGEILGISEDAVRSRLFRLRKLFVEKLNKS